MCLELKDDAVSLVDVIAPPDFVLNSALGRSDGEVTCVIILSLIIFFLYVNEKYND